jgi:quinol monooxygenase YgiN
MTVQIVRATTKPGHAADLEAAAAKVFAALGELQPGGLRYASLRVAEDSYLILLEVEDGAENPLPSMAAFQEFQAGLRDWLSGAPVIESASVVGSYRVL